MDEKDPRKFDAEQQHKLLEQLRMASERHIKTEKSLISDYLLKALDTSVYIGLSGGKYFNGGAFYIMRPPTLKHGEPLPPEYQYIYRLILDEEDAQRLAKEAIADIEGNAPADANGVTYHDGDGEPETLSFHLERIDVAEDRPLLFFELLTWLAIGDLMKAEKVDMADAVLKFAYGPDSGIVERPKDEEEAPELERGTVLLKSEPLDRSLHAGMLKKGLDSLNAMYIEETEEMVIPFGSDEAEEVRITTTKTLNDRYMSNGENATPLYLHAVLAAVHALMTSENAAEVGRIDGYVYIPSSTIIKQMSRTDAGPIKNPARSREALKLLHDAMLLLRATTIDARAAGDEFGETSTMTALLSGLQHLPMATYGGTTYKDVWILPAGTSKHMRENKALKYGATYPLIHGLPMGKPWEQATHQYARELVHQAYDKMTKSLKNSRREREYGEVTVSCETFFEKVRNDANPERRTKGKLMACLAKQIVAIALQTQEGGYFGADTDKFYLTMETKRDGHRGGHDGAWEKFTIKAWRKYHKPRAALGSGDMYTVRGEQIVRIETKRGRQVVTEIDGKKIRPAVSKRG